MGINCKRAVIFLDIDGVLFYNPMNGSVHKRVEERFQGRMHELPLPYPSIECDRAAVDLFSPFAVQKLHQLIASVQQDRGMPVGIVLSSDWREKGTITFLRELFQQHEFSQFIFDKTPINRNNRGEQIEQWLSEHTGENSIVDFVILDDYDAGLSERFSKRFVHCSHHRLFGDNEFDQAYKVLTRLK